jgi:ketosteroid isomerase-like protein
MQMATFDTAAGNQAANLATVERYAAAWRAGDRAAIADCYHDDFTLHYFGQNPFAGDHVGKRAALTALAKFAERTGRKLIAIVDVMAGPQRAAIIARESFERDGRRAEFERILVYAIRDGKLHECWVYDGDRAAVDVFLSDMPASRSAHTP